MARPTLLEIVGFVFLLAPTSVAWAEETAGNGSAKAGEYVQAALTYEAEGENDHRYSMLMAALKAAPDDQVANWHAGRVLRGGEWIEIAEAQRLAAADELLSQYRELRNRAGADPSLLLALARWCARQSLPELSKLHWARSRRSRRTAARSCA